MKLFSLKTLAAAVALSVPFMANAGNSAAPFTLAKKTQSDELTFILGDTTGNAAEDKADNYFSGSSTGLYNVKVDALWTNYTYTNMSGQSTVSYRTGYNIALDEDSTTSLSTHLVGGFVEDSANHVIHMTFANLASGDYDISMEGFWAKVKDSMYNKYKTLGKVDLHVVSVQNVSAVPEPESYAMLLAGLGLMGTIVARRRKNSDQA